MDLHELDAFRHSIDTPSGTISYLDTGHGAVALFVHGLATNAFMWRNERAAEFVPYLRRHWASQRQPTRSGSAGLSAA